MAVARCAVCTWPDGASLSGFTLTNGAALADSYYLHDGFP